MNVRKSSSLVQKVIKRYGPVIDLRTNPEILIDILRGLGLDDAPDGGLKPGGAPDPKPTPPPSSGIDRPVTNEDLLRAVLKLARDVADIRGSLKTLRAAKP
ncbi:MAG: hypothetical protein QOJ94_2992 [Sphingomonadales bacterium]|jgi:hypothetical protein|nr:hypothetical protein [Sphingomonadales bacterium]